MIHARLQSSFRLGLVVVPLWCMTGATAADNPNQAVIDQAEAAKALAEAQTAAANAQKAQYEAQAAALKAKFGDIPDSGYSGTATAGAGAGTAEANLLNAKALQAVAQRIAGEVCAVLPRKAGRCAAPAAAAASGAGASARDAARPIASAASAASAPPQILMFGATTVPDFQALTAFKAQYAFLTSLFDRATKAADPNDVARPAVRGFAPVAAIGLGLDAINKLLAFAKTDYVFANVDVSGTDAMLMNAVAQELPPDTAVLLLPAVYSADIDNAVNLAFTQITGVYELGVKARQNQRIYEGALAKAQADFAAQPNDSARKVWLEKCQDGAAIWKNVAETFEAWSKQATTADDKGNVPLSNVIRQGSVKQKLDAGALMLVLQLHKAGGTSYTKKNLWSSLGANPFFVMGGVVAGFTLFSGPDGQVIASGLVPWHGGYHPVNELPALVNR